MPHTASVSAARSAAPAACPVAVALASDMDIDPTPVVGTIVNVAGCHHEALRYVESIFHSSPVLSDTHGGWLKVQGLLGKGSWSMVYRATEMVHRKNFALKVVPQQGTHITSYYEEVRKMSKLKHPHIVEMYDHFMFEEADSPCPLLFIRMELCRFSLEQHIRREQQREHPMPSADIGTYVMQLASALAYIHRQGMLHGDVHSANVLLAAGPTGSMAVRLANFSSSQRIVRPGAAPLTITGGNRVYAPPEWVNSTAPCRPLTALEMPLPSYDLWGLGCVLSEMATMKLVSDERLLNVDSLATDLCCLAALKEEMGRVHDGLLVELCCGLLEVDPDERFSAEEVPDHLPAASSLPSTPRPKHGVPGLHRSSHMPYLLRPLGLLSRRH
eukprot:GGOE01060298.1.p1 GENE.GGOE01060298.1~~GGOE01060298.1.p1  ORF type:complete len:386 (+),score=80.95 GGOE01060298.1:103-1260(+)